MLDSRRINEGFIMSNRSYPEGIDCVWLASDREGYLAAFITAGIGPIPVQALHLDGVSIEDIESLICDMPRVSEVRLLVSVKRPDDFIDLAKRGIFVYDWTDINRIDRDAIHVYEPVATPVTPIKMDILLPNLAAIAKSLRLADVVFADGKRLDVRVHLSCQEAA
jgi:hypothetical protein